MAINISFKDYPVNESFGLDFVTAEDTSVNTYYMLTNMDSNSQTTINQPIIPINTYNFNVHKQSDFIANSGIVNSGDFTGSAHTKSLVVGSTLIQHLNYVTDETYLFKQYTPSNVLCLTESNTAPTYIPALSLLSNINNKVWPITDELVPKSAINLSSAADYSDIVFKLKYGYAKAGDDKHGGAIEGESITDKTINYYPVVTGSVKFADKSLISNNDTSGIKVNSNGNSGLFVNDKSSSLDTFTGLGIKLRRANTKNISGLYLGSNNSGLSLNIYDNGGRDALGNTVKNDSAEPYTALTWKNSTDGTVIPSVKVDDSTIKIDSTNHLYVASSDVTNDVLSMINIKNANKFEIVTTRLSAYSGGAIRIKGVDYDVSADDDCADHIIYNLSTGVQTSYSDANELLTFIENNIDYTKNYIKDTLYLSINNANGEDVYLTNGHSKNSYNAIAVTDNCINYISSYYLQISNKIYSPIALPNIYIKNKGQQNVFAFTLVEQSNINKDLLIKLNSTGGLKSDNNGLSINQNTVISGLNLDSNYNSLRINVNDSKLDGYDLLSNKTTKISTKTGIGLLTNPEADSNFSILYIKHDDTLTVNSLNKIGLNFSKQVSGLYTGNLGLVINHNNNALSGNDRISGETLTDINTGIGMMSYNPPSGSTDEPYSLLYIRKDKTLQTSSDNYLGLSAKILEILNIGSTGTFNGNSTSTYNSSSNFYKFSISDIIKEFNKTNGVFSYIYDTTTSKYNIIYNYNSTDKSYYGFDINANTTFDNIIGARFIINNEFYHINDIYNSKNSTINFSTSYNSQTDFNNFLNHTNLTCFSNITLQKD